MTDCKARKISSGRSEGKIINAGHLLLTLGGVASLILLSVFFSDDIAGYARDGLELAVMRVLPTALPFMLISSLASSLIYPESIPFVGRIPRAIGMPSSALGTLLIGNLAGFPIGAQLTRELYLSGGIGKDSAERLVAYSSNPSPSFVIATVGAGIFGDTALGLFLLLSIYLGTFFTAVIFRDKRTEIAKIDIIRRQKYSFVDSVRGASSSALYMISFITVFYILICAVKNSPLSEPMKLLLILPTEVTGAVFYLADAAFLPEAARLSLAAFSLGFGGISVLAQSAGVLAESGLSMKKYVIIKLIAALISSVFMLVFSLIFNV